MMRPLNSIYRILLVLGIGTGTLHAQSFEESLKKTQQFYAETTHLSIVLKTELYKKAGDAHPERTLYGSVARRGNDYLTNFNGKILLQNSRCALIVDMANRLLMYSKPLTDDHKQRELLNEFSNPDSLAKSAVTIKSISASETGEGYEIVPKKVRSGTGEPAKTTVMLNKSNHSLQSVVYVYLPHPSVPYERIVIRYTHRVGEQYVAKENFSEAKYVERRGSKITPTPEYQDFKVIQQDKKDLNTF